MRRRLVAALLVAGAGVALAAPATPAAAVCMDLHVEGFECVNPCYPVYAAYDRADGVVKDRLPDHLFSCLH